jgi:hypothetical protein
MNMADGSGLGAAYEIRFLGHVDGTWSSWLDGVVESSEVAHGDSETTRLTVRVPDQAALRGILNRLWDLNLTILMVCAMGVPGEREADHGS